jgi:hypothetical protein
MKKILCIAQNHIFQVKILQNFAIERNPGLEDSVWKRPLFNMKQKHKV